MRRATKRILVSPLLFVLAVVIVEGAYRVSLDPEDARVIREYQRFVVEGQDRFQPWPYVGYVVKPHPGEASDRTLPVDWRFDPPEDESVIRVACLGASTTRNGYPLALQEMLDVSGEGRYFVMNWGVPAWTSMETLVNYVANVQDYEPDVVVIHHGMSDVSPRLAGGYRTDYAHLRRSWREVEVGPLERWLASHLYLVARIGARQRATRFRLRHYVQEEPGGMIDRFASEARLPANTTRAYRRNLETIIAHAQSSGARVVLLTMPMQPSASRRMEDGSRFAWVAAVDEHNRIARELAQQHGCLLADAAAWVAENTEECEPLFVDRVHMTDVGSREKARLVFDALGEGSIAATQ